MELTVEAYLRRTSTQKLEKFLQDYKNGVFKEDFSGMIGYVVEELERRKEEQNKEAAQ